MRWSKMLAVVVGVIFLLIALGYAIAPDMMGAALSQGELAPQYGMPGEAVQFTMVSIPLGIMDLVLPIWSAVVVFAVVGLGLLLVGLTGKKRGA